MSVSELDCLEMQCYCDFHHYYYQDIGTNNHGCKNIIPYKNHHDWGRDEDFMCEECLNNCGEE